MLLILLQLIQLQLLLSQNKHLGHLEFEITRVDFFCQQNVVGFEILVIQCEQIILLLIIEVLIKKGTTYRTIKKKDAILKVHSDFRFHSQTQNCESMNLQSSSETL